MSTEPENPVGPSKTDHLKEIGAILSEKRKLRGLTHEKVGQTLKIRASFIKAIEEGNWLDLPGEVYARGYVSRYAGLLGLNAKDLLAPYLQSPVVEPVNPRVISQKKPTPEFSKSAWIWGGVALVFVFGLIKIIVSDQKKAHQMAPKEVPVATAVAVSTASIAAVPPAASVEHTLSLYSPFPLWLSVKAETRSFEGFLPQNTTWTWKAAGQFAIRIGHTQQIAMEFDGAPVVLTENQKKITLPYEN